MTEMGALRTTVGVENISRNGGVGELPETHVDTGTELTWIPRGILESLGIRPERRRSFVLADGRSVERDIGYAIVHVGIAATADDVVFAEEGDFALLGWPSLDGLNLRVDAVRQQLIDAGPVLAVALTNS